MNENNKKKEQDEYERQELEQRKEKTYRLQEAEATQIWMMMVEWSTKDGTHIVGYNVDLNHDEYDVEQQEVHEAESEEHYQWQGTEEKSINRFFGIELFITKWKSSEKGLLAAKKISKYHPAEGHIHVMVEPPVSTSTSSREKELLDKLAGIS
ncbi:hypothetical protein Glove_13g25 [Diversispora epigaea]|uniref:Uncharacterized protein n=1 Tax=Diversispora epigaea TaxID=1348612 RepID=A0A397JYR9_9GLOM|nr:hypothetical protein Glove_13g25 [Diversispora epigaea]